MRAFIDRSIRVRRVLVAITVLAMPMLGASIVDAQQMMAPPASAPGQIAGPYRVVLGFLPAEPFYTADQVAAQHVTQGMQIVGGAAPVLPDAPSHPNHHLVVHIFDATTGKAVQGATVTMAYALVGASGGAAVSVPVVEMQAVGMGPQSTHYGNNVTLAPGTYDVIVTINGTNTTTFVVKAD
jgi:hypothetical protein